MHYHHHRAELRGGGNGVAEGTRAVGTRGQHVTQNPSFARLCGPRRWLTLLTLKFLQCKNGTDESVLRPVMRMDKEEQPSGTQ